MATETTTTTTRQQEQRAFLQAYWQCLMVEHDWDRFASIVHPDCVVHYPGNHFLSGDHVGREAVVRLYQSLTRLGPATGAFVGELHDTVHSDDHCCALVKYKIIVGPGMEIDGDAVGVFHLQDGQMIEYWLLERDQKMINDIFNMGGKALLAGGAKKDMIIGAATHPLALARTMRRVARIKRGKNKRML